MKKKYLFLVVLSSLILSNCTLPWEKSTIDTETIVEDENIENGSNSASKTPTEVTKPIDITPSDTPKAIAEGGVYLPYTPTAVAQAQGQIVLFFHANWCPTCIAINKDIDSNIGTLPKDITILKVNYDDAQDLKTLYSITEQHTFAQVDNTGKLIKKWRGGETLVDIIGQVQK